MQNRKQKPQHEIDKTFKLLDLIGLETQEDRDLIETAEEHGITRVTGTIPWDVVATAN